MAGMFYSLQEVAAKLNKTEEEIKEIIKQGRLREFRDGPNLLFKVDEVEALMSDTRELRHREKHRLKQNRRKRRMRFLWRRNQSREASQQGQILPLRPVKESMSSVKQMPITNWQTIRWARPKLCRTKGH
jgi:hypothetical protein